MTRKEFERQRRVLDQSLTAHRHLAERLAHRARALTLAILILSVVATALAFAGETHETDVLGISASLPTWAGVLSTVVFALALVDLEVRWAAQAGRHEDAARRLSILKGQYRGAKVQGDTVDTGGLDLDAEYWDVMTTIQPIPDRLFVTLKARHVRKVAQSKLLDRAPGAPVALVRLTVRAKGLLALVGERQQDGSPAPFLPDESGSPEGRAPEQLPPEARGKAPSHPRPDETPDANGRDD